MKKPFLALLVSITAFVLIFTLGLFIGRNSRSGSITVSVPESMNAPLPQTEYKVIPDISALPAIDINTATLDELLTLPGIGTGLADEILRYRSACGGFTHPEQLLNVPGIGEKKLEAILGLITVGGTP